MEDILIFVLALLLVIGTLPITIISILITLFYPKLKNKRYLPHLTTSIDQFGNVLAQYWLNWFFIKPEGYKCGNMDETISSVMGKNKRSNTLTKAGIILTNVLHKIDKNHVEDAIEENP